MGCSSSKSAGEDDQRDRRHAHFSDAVVSVSEAHHEPLRRRNDLVLEVPVHVLQRPLPLDLREVIETPPRRPAGPDHHRRDRAPPGRLVDAAGGDESPSGGVSRDPSPPTAALVHQPHFNHHALDFVSMNHGMRRGDSMGPEAVMAHAWIGRPPRQDSIAPSAFQSASTGGATLHNGATSADRSTSIFLDDRGPRSQSSSTRLSLESFAWRRASSGTAQNRSASSLIEALPGSVQPPPSITADPGSVHPPAIDVASRSPSGASSK